MYGVYNMSGMQVVTQPGVSIPIELRVEAININVPVVRSYLEKQLDKNLVVDSDYRLALQIQVRACIDGEGLSETGACFDCPPGTFLL